MMAPEGKMDDGEFDLVIAGQVSRPGILALLPRFMMGTQADHPAVSTSRTAAIKVTALDGTLPAHADGETLSTAGQQLEITILPLALRVIGTDQEREL